MAIGQQLRVEYELPQDLSPELAMLLIRMDEQAEEQRTEHHKGAVKRRADNCHAAMGRLIVLPPPASSGFPRYPKGTSAGPQQVRQDRDVSRPRIPICRRDSRRAEADNRYSRIADKSHRYRNGHLRPASKRRVF